MPAAPSGRFWCAKCASPNPDKPPHVVGAWWRRLSTLELAAAMLFHHIPPHPAAMRRVEAENIRVIGPVLFFPSHRPVDFGGQNCVLVIPPWPEAWEAGDENRKTVQSATSGAMLSNPLRRTDVGVPR